MNADGETPWSNFYSLFYNSRGVKLRLNIPVRPNLPEKQKSAPPPGPRGRPADTVLFKDGMISSWFFTAKDGTIARKPLSGLNLDELRFYFLQSSSRELSNKNGYVAIEHGAVPRLLRTEAFNETVDGLKALSEAGGADVQQQAPFCLQAYVTPAYDIRYVCTYAASEVESVSEAFAYRYSRRYQETWTPERLDSDAGDSLPPIKDTLYATLQRSTAAVCDYMKRAHGLLLQGLVLEFVQDFTGKVYLLTVLRATWATPMPGRLSPHGPSLAAAAAADQHVISRGAAPTPPLFYGRPSNPPSPSGALAAPGGVRRPPSPGSASFGSRTAPPALSARGARPTSAATTGGTGTRPTATPSRTRPAPSRPRHALAPLPKRPKCGPSAPPRVLPPLTPRSSAPATKRPVTRPGSAATTRLSSSAAAQVTPVPGQAPLVGYSRVPPPPRYAPPEPEFPYEPTAASVIDVVGEEGMAPTPGDGGLSPVPPPPRDREPGSLTAEALARKLGMPPGSADTDTWKSHMKHVAHVHRPCRPPLVSELTHQLERALDEVVASYQRVAVHQARESQYGEELSALRRELAQVQANLVHAVASFTAELEKANEKIGGEARRAEEAESRGTELAEALDAVQRRATEETGSLAAERDELREALTRERETAFAMVKEYRERAEAAESAYAQVSSQVEALQRFKDGAEAGTTEEKEVTAALRRSMVDVRRELLEACRQRDDLRRRLAECEAANASLTDKLRHLQNQARIGGPAALRASGGAPGALGGAGGAGSPARLSYAGSLTQAKPSIYDGMPALQEVRYHDIRIEDLLKEVRNRELEKSTIRNLFMAHELELQYLFRLYCENGIPTTRPDISMRMVQFSRFAKDTKLSPPGQPVGEVDRIFIKANLGRDEAGMVHGQLNNPVKTMMIHEFVEGIIRLAVARYPDLGPVSARVEHALFQNVIPRANLDGRPPK
eukprot:tig00001098_g7061.t1